MSRQRCISKFIMLILAISLSGCGHSTKPDYLTAENDVPLVGGSINKNLTVELKYPSSSYSRLTNSVEFKSFLNDVLKEELELVFKSVQPTKAQTHYDLYVIPTITGAKGSDFKLNLAFGVNELGSGRRIVFSTLIDASPSGKEVLGDVAAGSGDALTTTAKQLFIITPFSLLMDIVGLPFALGGKMVDDDGQMYYPGKFTVDQLSNNYPKKVSKDLRVREVTSDYRNFSTKISEAVRVLMNQVIAYGDIEAKLKIALIEQKKAAEKAEAEAKEIAAEAEKIAAEAEKIAAARAKVRAVREVKKKAEAIRQAKIRKAAEAKQAKANKAKFKSIRRLAGRGDVNAQYNLGKIYHEGLLGVSWDHKEAVKWLIKAAVQGDNGARNRLVDIAPAAVDEVIRIQTMNKAKTQCTELGFTQGTDKHSDCAVRMFSTARADQRMKQQLKENRAENDRLIQESKTESYRRTLEQARLQRAALEAQKRQRDRDTGLRMMNLGAEMMQGNTGSKSNKIRCTSQSFGADLSQIDCQ